MSIFDRRETVSVPASWRCPHCRTVQAETTVCWACSRSTVTCSTCHLFRASVVADMGYCARDSARTPLRGDEVRACWERAPAPDVELGLFGELTGAAPGAPEASAQGPVRPPVPVVVQSTPRDAELDEAGADPLSGRLVDAPYVPPGKRLTPEP